MGVTPVLIVAGAGQAVAAEALALDPRLRTVGTPRAASVLIVLGDVGAYRLSALSLLHDQMPPPRQTLWTGERPEGWDGTVTDDPAAEAGRTSDLDEPDRLPDVPPIEWRGVGPNGQGGKGMMGGTPYGRQMAMTDADLRDGLMLDAYKLPAGPFHPALPSGFHLDVTLQGDVVQKVAVITPPLPQPELQAAPLLQAAATLRLLGLPAQADRLTRAYFSDLRPSKMLLRLFGAVRALPPGLATIGGHDARDRLRARLAGKLPDEAGGDETGGPSLNTHLRGLDWHSMCLAVASLSPDTLDRLCGEAMRAAEAEMHVGDDDNGHTGEGHGHHHHGRNAA